MTGHRRWVISILLISLGVLCGGAVGWAGRAEYKGFPIVRVLVNGQEITSDVPAIVVDGRTMLPVKAVADALGATVRWDGETQTVSLSASAKVTMPENTYLWLSPGENIPTKDFLSQPYAGMIAASPEGILAVISRTDIEAEAQGRLTTNQVMGRARLYVPYTRH